MFDNDDHRNVAQRLDLFHLQDDAPGWSAGVFPMLCRRGRARSTVPSWRSS